MKEFPKNLCPAKKNKFPKYRYNREMCYLRKEIYEFILKGDENSYFDLGQFGTQHNIKINDVKKMGEKISEELQQLGWKTTLHFGGTSIQIYSDEKNIRKWGVELDNIMESN